MKNKTIYLFICLVCSITFVFAQEKREKTQDAIETTIDFYIEQNLKTNVPNSIKQHVIERATKEGINDPTIIRELIKIENERHLRSEFFKNNPSLNEAYKSSQNRMMTQEVIDFEDGNLGGFTLETGTTTASCSHNHSLAMGTISTTLNHTTAPATLVSNGSDPHINMLNNQPQNIMGAGIPLPRTAGSSQRALRINQKLHSFQESAEVDIVSKTFVTDGSDITFDYATVLDLWGAKLETHHAYFRAAVLDASGGVLEEFCIEASDNSAPFLTLDYDGTYSNMTEVRYTEWTTHTFVSPGNEDDVLTLLFEAGDCAQTIHAGYAYVDNIILGSKPDPCDACNITPSIQLNELTCNRLDVTAQPQCSSFFYSWDIIGQPGNVVLTGSNTADYSYGSLGGNPFTSLDVTLTISDSSGCSSSTTQSYTFCDPPPPSGLCINTKVFLQGPLMYPVPGEEKYMRDDLRAEGLIPTISPYGDGTTCNASIFNATGPDAIVDWVYVELRKWNAPTAILDEMSAFVQRDGDVVGMDGVSMITTNRPAGDYLISIKHRNHLGVLSKKITLDETCPLLDFTSTATSWWGQDAMVRMELLPGQFRQALWAGDANNDQKINHQNQFGSFGTDGGLISTLSGGFNGTCGQIVLQDVYHNADLDMDGDVDCSGGQDDSELIKDNVIWRHPQATGSGSFIIYQQIPN